MDAFFLLIYRLTVPERQTVQAAFHRDQHPWNVERTFKKVAFTWR